MSRTKARSPDPVPPPSPDMAVVSLPVADLHVDPANVRRHPDRNLDAIKASLARFGQQKPIVVDSNGVVRAGNGTLEAARALGWETIACVRTPLAGTEATAYAIADNRTSELAEWDETALAETLGSLVAEEISLADLGFDETEYDRLFDVVGTPVDDGSVKLKPVPPPGPVKACWVLACVPVDRYGEVDALVREIAKVPGVICEVAGSMRDKDTGQKD